ncbi:energy-coupling factor transporter transmembrane protein EcfT [Azoarcus sp. PA01]|nr:energy-coupling factor transporter transmembrane protein EcfT [Azoarcus sp. PA01]
MHAGLLILMWAAGVVVIQAVSGVWLLAAVIGSGLVASLLAPARSGRLVRRVRFLLLAIVVFFAWFTPGEALVADWPALSPTAEGMLLAAQHGGRLVAVVFCVAILLQRLSVDRLVSGLYALLRPLEFAGLPASRLAVRLLLVLRYVEAGAEHGWTHWLDEADDASDETISVVRERFGLREIAVSALCIAIGMALLGIVK